MAALTTLTGTSRAYLGCLLWILQWALTISVGLAVGCFLLIGVAWVVYYARMIFYPRPLSWGEVALETVGYYTRKKVSDRMLSWMAPVFPATSMQIPALEYYVR